MSDLCVVLEPGTVRFERLLLGPIERVWEYLTVSEKRRTWFASGKMELKAGTPFQLHFMHKELSSYNEAVPEPMKQKLENGHSWSCRMTQCDPPHSLTFVTGDEPGDESEVTFALKPKGEKVLFTLTHRRLKDMKGYSAGWHSHLAVLEHRLNGVEPPPFWPAFAENQAKYAEIYGSKQETAAHGA